MSVGRPISPPAWTVYASLAAAGVIVYLAVPSTPVRDGLYLAVAYSAAAVVVAATWVYRPPARAAWWWAGAGIALVATGHALLYAEASRPGEGRIASGSNAAYLAGYLAYLAAILLLLRLEPADPRRTRETLVDAAAVATAALVVGWTFLASPVIFGGHAGGSERAEAATSLLLDVVLVALATLLLLRRNNPVFSRRLVLAGLFVLIAGDALWHRDALVGSDEGARWFEILVPLAYALWGTAALHPSMRDVVGAEERSGAVPAPVRLGLLALLTAAVPVALAFGDLDLDRPADLAVIAVASALIPLLVVARLAMALRELEGVARAARAAERRLRALIEASPVPIVFLGRDRRVAVWNRAAERATGWEERELAGARIPAEAVPEAALRRVRDALVRSDAARIELTAPRRDGSVRDWEVSVARVEGDGSPEAGFVAVAMDVTERNRAGATLRESEERFRGVFETALDAILILDDTRRCVDANPAACDLFGLPRDDLVGQQADDASLPGTAIAELWSSLVDRGQPRGERELRLARGRRTTIEFTAKASFLPGRHLFVIRDITERRRQRERMEYVTSHDALTGLSNRRAFEDGLARAVKRARRGPAMGLLLVDVDNFKLVNDTAGHPAGDRFLLAIANMLRASLRPGDHLARLGGDEFAVTLEDVSEETAKQIAGRIVEDANAFRFYEGGQVFDLGVSVGLCLIDGTMKPAEALAVADSALVAAKEQGKNRAVLWGASRADRSELVLANSWVARIRQAIRENGLVLALQPVVDLETRRPVHFEALVRMRSAGGELVPPSAFLPAAARFGLMSEVDRWVIDHTIQLLEADPELRLFVNLAGSSLADDELFEWIESTLRRTRLEPGRLGIEITEQAAVRDMAEAARRLASLRDLGCQLALDDFGVDFASFEPLRRLPLDFVKVGDTFVRDLLEDEADRAIVAAITTVSHALGKRVIVEGVQSDAAVDLARSFGIEYGQGYMFGPPDSARFLELMGGGREAARHGHRVVGGG